MIHKAKKSLGQNFLKSEIALRKIIEAGDIKENDVILEIGPGKGALTEKLLQTGAKIIAVEKDRELFEFLKEKFASQIKSGSLLLLNEDILEFKVSETFPKFFSGYPALQTHHSKNLEMLHYKIIANIPYNITGAILKKFLTEKNQPECMVLMVQHEVAKRIVARDKKESILSISVKAYGEPKLIMKVAARYFSPAPKVDSAIIKISNISRKLFTSPETPSAHGISPLAGGEKFEEKFWEIVKAGFAHKRKKLSSNLKTLSTYGGVASVEDLGNKRAEDLTLEDWIILARK